MSKRNGPSELFEKASNGDIKARRELWKRGMEEDDDLALLQLGVLRGLYSSEYLEELLEEIGDMEDEEVNG